MSPTNLGELYTTLNAEARRGKVYVELAGSRLSYRHLVERINLFSTWVAAQGWGGGERVLIVTHHDEHAITLFLGALLNGLCPILLTADTRSERAQAICAKARPAHTFLDREVLLEWPWMQAQRFTEIVVEPRGNTLLNSLLGKTGPGDTYPALLAGLSPASPRMAANQHDPAYIVFTSGTTSAPKGVVVTQRNLFSHLATLQRVFGYTGQARILNNLVLAHADGLVQGPLLAAFAGATLVRPERFEVRNLEVLLSRIVNDRISHFITVPTVLSLIDRFARDNDYFRSNDFRHLISAAALLDPNLWQRLEARLGIRICNLYGLTETVAGGLFCGPDDATFGIGGIGKPVDMEARVMDDSGAEVTPGQEGELELRGANVTPGYFEDAEATSALFHDGWLRSGDIVTCQPDGQYRIRGRKKALIMSGGFNIHPDEINEALRRFPGVADAVTIPMPDADWGELAYSVVECANPPPDEVELFAHCRTHLEAMKVPRRIFFIEHLPRGLSGKVQLPAISEWVRMQLENGCARTEGDCPLEALVNLAEEVFRLPAGSLSGDAKPAEVPGWDSLGHLNLVAAVEASFGINLTVQEILSIDSLRVLHGVVYAHLQIRGG